MAVQYDQSIDELNQIAKGYTSSVYRVPLEHQVVKVVNSEIESLERRDKLYGAELAAYQRMSMRTDRPNSILKFYGSHPTIERGLRLELAERGDMYTYLWKVHKEETPPEPFILLRWAEQLSEALEFVHSCDILHCDIHTLNCFLDEDLNLKLGDFGACAMDGGRPSLMYRSTHQLWQWDNKLEKWNRPYSVASEIFALGCTMYHMEKGEDAFDDLDRDDDTYKDTITKKLQQKEMPSVDGVPILGRFIDKCWKLQYSSMADVVRDIRTDTQGVRL